MHDKDRANQGNTDDVGDGARDNQRNPASQAKNALYWIKSAYHIPFHTGGNAQHTNEGRHHNPKGIHQGAAHQQQFWTKGKDIRNDKSRDGNSRCRYPCLKGVTVGNGTAGNAAAMPKVLFSITIPPSICLSPALSQCCRHS